MAERYDPHPYDDCMADDGLPPMRPGVETSTHGVKIVGEVGDVEAALAQIKALCSAAEADHADDLAERPDEHLGVAEVEVPVKHVRLILSDRERLVRELDALSDALWPLISSARNLRELPEEAVVRFVYDDPEYGPNTVAGEWFVRAFRRAAALTSMRGR